MWGSSGYPDDSWSPLPRNREVRNLGAYLFLSFFFLGGGGWVRVYGLGLILGHDSFLNYLVELGLEVGGFFG